jgi:hypothetical protein
MEKSGMKIIRPITITDAMLTSSNVAENDYTEFAMATSYGDGDYCIVATGLEILTLDVAPVTDWVAGDILTGKTSSKTCVAVKKITSLTYYVRERTGAFTLGEVIGVTGDADKLADQGAAHPTITASTDKVHKIYESLTAGNVGNYPPLDVLETVPKWLEIGYTNRWKAFDTKIGTQTTNADSITYKIAPGEIFDSIAFFGLEGATVRITLTDPVDGVVYDHTIKLIDVTLTGTEPEMDWYAYFFSEVTQLTETARLGMSLYLNAVLDITITYTGGTAKVGTIVIGKQMAIGKTQYSPTIGITDYSVKDTDAWGNTIITERAYADKMSCDVIIPNSGVPYIYRMLANLRATVLVFVGADESIFPSLIKLGFYRDFNVVMQYPTYSICSIDIEGII